MAVDRARDGEMPEAVRMYRQSASLYQKLGNVAEEGYVFSLLGDEAMQRTQFEHGRAYYVKAMALSQEANDYSRIAGRLLDLGIVELSEGHNMAARELFSQSADEFDKLGQKDRAAISRIRLGVSLYRAGRIDDAERTLKDSLEVMRSFGRLNQVREALGDLAKVELWKDPQQAERVARDNLNLNQQILERRVCCSPSIALLAETLLSEGKLPEAQDMIRQAFSSENELSSEWLPEMLLTRANIRMAKNDLGGADDDFKRALEMGNSRGDRYFELQARLGLAEIDILRKARSSKIELERLKHDADNSGMAIFDIKIAFFLRTLHPAP
jgi:tetratricopeptide (TPR) repeat protein